MKLGVSLTLILSVWQYCSLQGCIIFHCKLLCIVPYLLCFSLQLLSTTSLHNFSPQLLSTTFLHNFSPQLLSLQLLSTTSLHNFSLQLLSTTSLHNFSLQLLSTTSLYNFSPQLLSTTSLHNFSLQLLSTTSLHNFSLQLLSTTSKHDVEVYASAMGVRSSIYLAYNVSQKYLSLNFDIFANLLGPLVHNHTSFMEFISLKNA